MPTYDSILFKFYSEYEKPTDGREISFAKTTLGWEIYTIEYTADDPKLSDRKLYWSKAKGKYQRIPYKKRKSRLRTMDEVKAAGYQPRFHHRYSFERCAYFGYPQWSWDMIREYGSRKDLSATEMEGLSRAFYNYASGYIYGKNNELTANGNWPSRNFDLDTLMNPGRKNIDSFLLYENLALYWMQKLADADPNYQVIVGSIRNKLANEYMDICLKLSYFGYYELALPYLQKVQFGNDIILAAKNMLNACPENAIIFTNGDNDTYPAWYVQQVLGFRKDVTVANISLLNLPQYCNMLVFRKTPFGQMQADALKSFGEKHHPIHTAVITNTSLAADSTFPADSLISFFYSRQKPDDATMFQARYILVTRADHKTMKYRLAGYSLPSDIMIFDVIQSNNRPICYSALIGTDIEQWNGYRGLAGNFLLTSDSIQRTDSAAIALFFSDLYQPLESDPKADLDRDQTCSVFIMDYLENMAKGIAWAHKNGNSAIVEGLIAKALNIYPDHNFHFNQGWVFLATALLDIGRENEAKKIIGFLKNYIQKTEPGIRKNQSEHPTSVSALDANPSALYQLNMLIYHLESTQPESLLLTELKEFVEPYAEN